jgi:hypothetical protein
MERYYTQVADIDFMVRQTTSRVEEMAVKQSKLASYTAFELPIATFNLITSTLHKTLNDDSLNKSWNELVDYE